VSYRIAYIPFNNDNIATFIVQFNQLCCGIIAEFLFLALLRVVN